MSVAVVYPRMACEFVGARETFFAAAEGAGKRLLAGVSADVASLLMAVRADKGLLIQKVYLMFESTERSSAFWIRTLVGTGGDDLVLGLRG